MSMFTTPSGDITSQLEMLYQEREEMNNQIGCADANDVINMVRSLEAQLRDFYSRFGHLASSDDVELANLMVRINEVSTELDRQFSQKQITLSVENGQPTLRATWTSTNPEDGDR